MKTISLAAFCKDVGQENMERGCRRGCEWFMHKTELYNHAKFGGDRTHAGCRCENMAFVCLFVFFVTLRGWRAVRSRVT